jgi:hypothetical protein
LPAVPPAEYTRHKEYFTENGQCLVKEYFLGFKTGQEIAIASGQRQILTVPVLLPLEPTGPPAFTVAPGVDDQTPPMIPPRPLDGIEPTSGSTSDVPRVVVPRNPAALRTTAPVRPAGLVRKSSPPAGFSPIAKPLLASGAPGAAEKELPASALIEPDAAPLPLPPRKGPSGPEVWGELPAIPAISSGPPVSTPQLPPPADQLTPRVTPPNHTVRPPLPPNHPTPHH